jgi:hypothetical protein
MIKEKFYVKRGNTFTQIKFEYLKDGDIIRKWNDDHLWLVQGKVFKQNTIRTVIAKRFRG